MEPPLSQRECKSVTLYFDPMDTVVLSSLYLAPIHYYSKIFRCKKAIIDVHENYQKQSYRNRCNIVGANGLMPLSIPVEKPQTPKCAVKDIRIAEHGNWRHLHWQAIISAYNPTPFFEYYANELQRFYEKQPIFLADFNLQLHQLICRWLQLDTPTEFSSGYVDEIDAETVDFREIIHPKRNWKTLDTAFSPKPYYQVFRNKMAFVENASIIDLLFNMGNESRLYL